MITLEKYRKQLSEFYEYLLDKFFKKELLIPDQLTLSAIGVRICYSTAPDFAELLGDPRISKETEKFAFLKRLYEAKHDSVFAHSPILFAEKDRFQKFNVFKLWQFYKSSITHFCASARHLVEAMRYRNLDFDVLATSVKKQTPFSLKYTSEREGNREIIVIRLPETKPWWWTSVIAFGVSRVMTHQFVRHTWLNFSQRSHRYTPVDGYAFPETITRKPFLKGISEEVIEFFKELKEKVPGDVKKEDLRYLYPHGVQTTIMASGPHFVWEHFISVRKHPKAQLEIRKFAEIVEKKLFTSQSGEEMMEFCPDSS